MNSDQSASRSLLAKAQIETEVLLEQVPENFRGLRFDRLLSTVSPSEVTRKLEQAFALKWVHENCAHEVLTALLTSEDHDQRKVSVPRNEREWQVAELVAATVIQWLGTPVGTCFLTESFRQAGGRLQVTLPQGD